MLKPRVPYVLAHWAHLQENFNTSAQDVYSAVEEAVRSREAANIVFSRVLWKEGGVASADREYLRVQRGRLAFGICAAPYGNGYFFSSWLARVPFGNAPLWLFLFVVLLVGGFIGMMVLVGILQKAMQLDGIPCGLYFLTFIGVGVATPLGIFILGTAIHQGHFLDEDLVVSIPWVGYVYSVLFNPNAYYRLDTAMMFRTTVHSAMMEVLDGLFTEQGIRALSPEQRQATIRSFTQ